MQRNHNEDNHTTFMTHNKFKNEQLKVIVFRISIKDKAW